MKENLLVIQEDVPSFSRYERKINKEGCYNILFLRECFTLSSSKSNFENVFECGLTNISIIYFYFVNNNNDGMKMA